MRIVKEREAVVGSMTLGLGLSGDVIPMFITATCCRSNCGFFGFTASNTIRTTARTTRARKAKRRKRQQQHPLRDADEEEEEFR